MYRNSTWFSSFKIDTSIKFQIHRVVYYSAFPVHYDEINITYFTLDFFRLKNQIRSTNAVRDSEWENENFCIEKNVSHTFERMLIFSFTWTPGRWINKHMQPLCVFVLWNCHSYFLFTKNTHLQRNNMLSLMTYILFSHKNCIEYFEWKRLLER